VQGAVQLVNYRDRWYSVRNCLEYFFWFRSRLHFHAGRHFVPLGGNTVFISAPLLHAARGWDPECLAEDCELGARLTSMGARVAVAYDPELATREETPASLSELARQRSRWNQGFLQVLRKGDWRRLPRRERTLAWFTLSQPFLQAFTAVVMPLSIGSILFLRAPVGLALISFAPMLITLTMLGVEVAGLREFCRLYGRRPRLLDYGRLVVGTFPYQLMLAYAAVRAAWRHVRGRREWEKTAHVGAHLEPREAM
jgi:cellulose synthase/poly-beta-1,6-N-acetylglucosamine synthase-like glycosyltransferase